MFLPELHSISSFAGDSVFHFIGLVNECPARPLLIYTMQVVGNFLNTLSLRKEDSRKTSLKEIIVSNLVDLLLWVHVQILLNILVNFGKLFLQEALLGYLFKERILKNKRLFYYPGMKYSYLKYCPGYAAIPPWKTGITPGWNGMRNTISSCKRNSNL